MRNLLAMLLLAVSFPVLADGIYTWTDGDGNRVFSDAPREGAERVRIEDSRTGFRQPRDVQRPPTAADTRTAGESAGDYDSLAIVDPGQEDTVRDNRGIIEVTVRLEPELQPDHRVVVESDRGPVSEPKPDTTVRLTEVHRGEHNIVARVITADGDPLIASEPVRFYMQQASALLPQSGN